MTKANEEASEPNMKWDKKCPQCGWASHKGSTSFVTDGRRLQPSRILCRVTGNDCGTDTWPEGDSCPCANCQEWLRLNTIEGLQEALRRLQGQVDLYARGIAGLEHAVEQAEQERDALIKAAADTLTDTGQVVSLIQAYRQDSESMDEIQADQYDVRKTLTRLREERDALREALKMTGSALPDGSLCWCAVIAGMADGHDDYCANARALTRPTDSIDKVTPK